MEYDITALQLSRIVMRCIEKLEQSDLPARPNLLLGENIEGEKMAVYALTMATGIGLVFPNTKPQVMRMLWRKKGEEWNETQGDVAMCTVLSDRVLDIEGSRSLKAQEARMRRNCHHKARQVLGVHRVSSLIETKIDSNLLSVASVEPLIRAERWSSFLLDLLQEERALFEAKQLAGAPVASSSRPSSRPRL